MIHYLLTSAILLLIGWAFYFFQVRRKGDYLTQKRFIHVSIITSLLLPLFVSPVPKSSLTPSKHVQPIAFGQIDEGHLKQYCKCESPDYSHRLLYQANGIYNVLFDHKDKLTLGILLAIGFMLIRFFIQSLFLIRLVKKSVQKRSSIDGDSFILLFPHKPMGAGAFQLKESYIIWQDEMASLNEAEQEAVFRHELSHLKQKNTLEKAFLNVIQCFWFFHPIFYYYRKELNLISECIADQAGVQAMPNRQAYATLLLKLKSIQMPALVDHFKGSVLKIRIERLLSERHQVLPIWRSIGLFFMLIMVEAFVLNPLSAKVQLTLAQLQTYETVYHHVDPGLNEAVYCPDCDSVCYPEPEEPTNGSGE